MSAMTPTSYIVIIRPLPSAAPVEVRMRRALKAMLRSLSLRCLDIREIKNTPADAGIQQADTGPSKENSNVRTRCPT